VNQNSISQNFISLKKGELSRTWSFSREVQKGHTKGHKGQGQFGRADENVADDPRYYCAKLYYTPISLCIIVMAERLHYVRYVVIIMSHKTYRDVRQLTG